MATLTYADGHVVDLVGTTGFEMRIHPGDSTQFHIHAIGSGIVESIWKQTQMQDAARDRNDFARYVLEEDKNVKEDEDTGRIIPDE